MKFIKVPTSQGSLGRNKGTEKAPDALIPDAEGVEVVEGNIEDTNENIEKAEGDFFVGGDHSITYPLFRKFASEHKNPALLIFDAHADTVNNFHPPTHEDFNKVLVDEGTFKPENLFIIGLRHVDKIEQDFLDEKGIKHLYMKDVPSKEELIEQIKEFAEGKDLYLSVDIDSLDPRCCPGTGFPVDGGFELDDLLWILGQIKDLPKRIDLVEINPEKDVDERTVESGKRVIDTLSSLSLTTD